MNKDVSLAGIVILNLTLPGALSRIGSSTVFIPYLLLTVVKALLAVAFSR
jgi:hypothetical protein